MLPTLHEPPENTSSVADSAAAAALLLPVWLARHHAWATVKDLETGRYLHADAGLAEQLGLAAGGLVGRTDGELFESSIAAALRASEQTALAQGAALFGEHQFEFGGRRHDFEVMRLVLDTDGRRLLAAIWHDRTTTRLRDQQLRSALEQIEQQQREHERLRREVADLALRDPASGLHHRAHFEEQLRREVDLSQREHREFSLVFLELDEPSPKVQALGNAGERAVLEAMGRLLRGGTRAMDASCRWGERRFAVLLSGVGLATAHSRMEGLRRKCATQIVVHEGQEIGFTTAVGVASFPHTAHSQEALLEAALAALDEARRRGGNSVTLAAIRFDAV
jgi:diguanylate cyclase (GGDEF)-like protein